MGGRAGMRWVLIPQFQFLSYSKVCKTNTVTSSSILSHVSLQPLSVRSDLSEQLLDTVSSQLIKFYFSTTGLILRETDM